MERSLSLPRPLKNLSLLPILIELLGDGYSVGTERNYFGRGAHPGRFNQGFSIRDIEGHIFNRGGGNWSGTIEVPFHRHLVLTVNKGSPVVTFCFCAPPSPLKRLLPRFVERGAGVPVIAVNTRRAVGSIGC